MREIRIFKRNLRLTSGERLPSWLLTAILLNKYQVPGRPTTYVEPNGRIPT